jgi:hypothetical protein
LPRARGIAKLALVGAGLAWEKERRGGGRPARRAGACLLVLAATLAPPFERAAAATSPRAEWAPDANASTNPSGSSANARPRVVPDWDPDLPPPPGYHVETHARKGLVIGGAVPLGVFWGISSLVAAASRNTVALYVPAIGPFVQFTKSDTGIEKFLAAFDGVVQSAGLFMLVYGLAVPRTELVENSASPSAFRISPVPVPVVGSGTAGLAWVGHF